MIYNECTCGPDDPCNWIGDGYCDTYICASVTSVYFDDSADCGGGALCGGECGLGVFSSCTCGTDDPCGWARDGYCDTPQCLQVATGQVFDDTADCGGGAGSCDGECAAGRYSACTCGSGDPCGWSGDGDCDQRACEGLVGAAAFDDSADCDELPGDETFGVTAVRDDLDNSDLEVMASGLEQLGYDLVVRDLNVSSSALSGYFSQELTTLYHTGHGFEEGISTSDGVLYVNQISLGVRHAVIATCLALVGSWSGCFGPETEDVLGYSMVSFDVVDDTVATQFLDALERGSSYPEAWYQANATIGDVSDRWVVYAREGDSFIEYSARSGVVPQAGASDGGAERWIPLGRSGRLLVAPGLLDGDEPFAGDVALAEVAVDPTAQSSTEFLVGGWSRLRPSRLGREQALELAWTFVEARLGGMPLDASQERISEVLAREQGQPPDVVAYIVRFGRRVAGFPVRGNLIADHLTLLVTRDGVVSWSRYWPEISVEVPVVPYPTVLHLNEAVQAAADSIERSVKGELRLISARAVLGTLGAGRGVRRLIPAYELIGEDGSTVVIDALTGHVIR